MPEELIKSLIEALNENTKALEESQKLKIITRKELQEQLGAGNQTMQEIFEDKNFMAQRMGKKDFATIEAVNNYFTNYRHERN